MVGVGGIGILDLLQNTNDLTAACLNSHHFENSEQTRPEQKSRHLATFKEIRNYSCLLPARV